MDYVLDAITKNYANFSGRARRKEYWLFVLANSLIQIGVSITLGLSEVPPVAQMVIVWAIMLALLVPGGAVSVRRLHDTERSAWWLLIALIPLAGFLILFIFMCLDGTVGDNRYGPDPKGRIMIMPQAIPQTVQNTPVVPPTEPPVTPSV
jgi:uncharacterized membrane protein YhaH (DUF805 family)